LQLAIELLALRMQLAIDIPALGSTPLLGSSEKLLLLRLGGHHVRLLEDLGLSKQLRTLHLSRRALIAQSSVISTALVAQLLQSFLEGHHRRLLGLERLEQCISPRARRSERLGRAGGRLVRRAL